MVILDSRLPIYFTCVSSLRSLISNDERSQPNHLHRLNHPQPNFPLPQTNHLHRPNHLHYPNHRHRPNHLHGPTHLHRPNVLHRLQQQQ